MGKRIVIILLVFLISTLAIMGYFLQQGRKRLYSDPYKAVSSSACIVIETVDLHSFINSLTTEKGLFGEISKVKELENFNRKLRFFTDQLNKAGFKKILTDCTAIISFHLNKEGQLKPLLSVTVPGEIRYRHINEAFHSAGIKEIIESKLNGFTVLEIPYTSSNINDTAYISILSGLIVCTLSEELMEEACLQVSRDKDVRNMPGFSRVLLASGKKQDKVFVIFANIERLFQSFMGPDAMGMAKKIARLAGTAAADIYINEEGLVLSGYTESTDSSEYLYRHKSIPPREFNTYKILPSSTVLFETIILPSEKLDFITNTKGENELFTLAQRLREYVMEITRAYIDIKERPVSENTLVIYKLTNRSRAEQIFHDELGPECETLYFNPDDQIKIPVYKISSGGLTDIMIPDFAPEFKGIYITFYDNYMIAGESYVTISRLLYDNLLNKTLANDLTYREFESTLPSRSGYFFYCIPSRITDFLALYLNDGIINTLKSNRNSLNKIQAAGYQFAASNGMIYNSLSIKYKEEVREESTTEWETLLDTLAGIKPFFFTNHITGAKEIFIQDMKNNTYLINAAGRVLWKVPLNEKINGTIFMIDYFRNGKYQLLFSGRNYIHLLDRNGNYVERYPVRLRSPATNSLALFDYDNNLNYRLFIAGEDKMIYSYDKTGNVVKGWKPFRTSGYVRAELNYFKVSGKDYLVAADENTVYFLDRTGNKRVNLKESVTKAAGSAMRLIPGSESSLVCTSPDGTVQNIYFDGSVKKFSLKNFSVDHSFDIFDIDGDGFGEYIFIDKGILYLYDHNRSEIFVRDFLSGELGGPISFIFSSEDRKIGLFDINKKLIYLINKSGETMRGFPLRGASMFSIGKLSDKSGWHLIVGGTDRFLYNYKIDKEIK